MVKKSKTTKSVETVQVIVQSDAPFDVLKHGECRVGKEIAVDAPKDIENHRHAKWLDFIS